MIIEQYFIQILKKIMALDDSQIWIASQNKQIPNTTGLFVQVQVADNDTLSNTSQYVYSRDIPCEVYEGDDNSEDLVVLVKGEAEVDLDFLVDSPANAINSVVKTNIQIDLVSRDNTARDSRVLALACLASYYSQQIQQANNLRIFSQSKNFINTTELEGGSQLNRFSVIIPALYLETNYADFDYYDTFSEETIFNS